MKTPRLNRKLVLETPNRLSDGAGGFVVAWQSLGIVWAEVTARTGRETTQAAAPISAMNYRIVVRATPHGSVDRPKPEQRFRAGERVYLIRAVAEEDPDGRYLTCFASEETAV